MRSKKDWEWLDSSIEVAGYTLVAKSAFHTNQYLAEHKHDDEVFIVDITFEETEVSCYD